MPKKLVAALTALLLMAGLFGLPSARSGARRTILHDHIRMATGAGADQLTIG